MSRTTPAIFISDALSTMTPLGADGEWVTAWVNVEFISQVTVFLHVDQKSALNGLEIRQSVDGVTVDDAFGFTIEPGATEYHARIDTKYIQVRYLNGATPQGIFRVQAKLQSPAQLPYPLYGPEPDTVFLTNSGSREMNVAGTATFSYVVPPGESWRVSSLGVLFIDNGSNAATNFGAGSALTNGVLLEYKVNRGVNRTLANIQSNADWELIFDEKENRTGGFLNAEDAFSGRYNFDPELRLLEGDYVRATVRDNLTAIDFFRMTLKLWRSVT